jgi:hypothetical protein
MRQLELASAASARCSYLHALSIDLGMSQDLRLDDWRAVTILGFGVDVPEISLIVLL